MAFTTAANGPSNAKLTGRASKPMMDDPILRIVFELAPRSEDAGSSFPGPRNRRRGLVVLVRSKPGEIDQEKSIWQAKPHDRSGSPAVSCMSSNMASSGAAEAAK